jgi:outer membrane immunogenic protein
MRFCLTLAVGCALSVGAQAADLSARAPMYQAPMYMTAVYDWTGFYIGGNAGGGWQDNRSASFIPNGALLASVLGPPPPQSFRSSGAVGGAQYGFNWQFHPNWVVGVETDFDFSDIKGNGSANFLGVGGLAPQLYSSTASEQITWFGTVRGRLGFVPISNLLIYGTGGFAYGKVDQSAGIVNVGGTTVGVGTTTCVGFAACYAGTSSRTAFGWTAGGGAEYGLSRNWTIRAEYLYVDLGSNNFAANIVAPGAVDSFTARFNPTTFNVVRGGFNFRF